MTATSNTSLQLVKSIIEKMPVSIRNQQMTELARFAYEVGLVRRRVPPGSAVLDIGGGWGVFALGMAAAGMKSTMLDDFGDVGFRESAADAMRVLWTRSGVEVTSRDPGSEGLGLAPRSLDAVTTFDCLEHWHHSPKRMLHEALDALKPGGLFVLGTPNCANLRKRISAVLGRTAWSAMDDWYEKETFRGHVREPSVQDLVYIGRDIGLVRTEIIGRNFAGSLPTRPRWIRTVTPMANHLLMLHPSLCSNIYLLGRKP